MSRKQESHKSDGRGYDVRQWAEETIQLAQLYSNESDDNRAAMFVVIRAVAIPEILLHRYGESHTYDAGIRNALLNAAVSIGNLPCDDVKLALRHVLYLIS